MRREGLKTFSNDLRKYLKRKQARSFKKKRIWEDEGVYVGRKMDPKTTVWSIHGDNGDT